jgi:3-phenylpropionate/trans-cinnamate dioxygenase ferredoxin subunit
MSTPVEAVDAPRLPASQMAAPGATRPSADGRTIVHAVCRTEELPPGERKIVAVAGRSIGVFNVNGVYYALRNACPHRHAPLCLGRVRGLVLADQPYDVRVEREGEIIACPWHGWEFDITTGRSHFNPHKLWVRTYDVTVAMAAEPPPAAAATPECDADPSVETYAVTTDQGTVLLHVPV